VTAPDQSHTEDGTAYTRSGPQGAPCVVMIHGLGLCEDVWQWQRPALDDAYDVITYDLFGHGRSALSPAEPSLSVFAAQLATLMDDCALHGAAIVGFSLGGMIARRFAQDHPDRTRALGILHSPHQRSPAAQDAILARVAQARIEGPASTVEAALERWFTAPFRGENPDMMDLVRGWVLANNIDIYHRNYKVLADGINEITAPVPPINVPALVMTADEDFGNNPEMSHAIAAEIAGAETLILKGLRHMALAEAPQRTNAPLRQFLDRNLKGDN